MSQTELQKLQERIEELVRKVMANHGQVSDIRKAIFKDASFRQRKFNPPVIVWTKRLLQVTIRFDNGDKIALDLDLRAERLAAEKAAAKAAKDAKSTKVAEPQQELQSAAG